MSVITLERDEAVAQVSPVVPKPEEPTVPELRGWALVAQLIREGSQKRPQSYRGYFEHSGGIAVRSCALGALWEGLTGRTEFSHHKAQFQQLNALCQERTGVNLCHLAITPGRIITEADTVGSIIMRLNDQYHWSRELIANWVEALGYRKANWFETPDYHKGESR